MNMAETTTRDTQLVITANFTADPTIRPLVYWFAHLPELAGQR